MQTHTIVVELDGCDRLELLIENEKYSLKVIGCTKLLQLLSQLKYQFGSDVKLWVLPEGSNHELMLVRELILKAKGDWNYPYQHEELCHCRMVPTDKVLNVIKQNCFTTGDIARTTMAGTGCGSCKKDSEALLQELLVGLRF